MSDAERLARAVLLFHKAPIWGPEQRDEWHSLIGKQESATTVTLCDLAREVLARAGKAQ